jgi:N utilization substance protein B
MSRLRDARRCALQALYQFDCGGGDDDAQVVRDSLARSPGDEAAHAAGFELAAAAWSMRERADAAIDQIAPQWPTHRQPVVDRNILRLAFYEMTTGRTPPKVAINEAIELAREFSTERSPMFVNGVLDKLYRSMRQQGPATEPEPAPETPMHPVPQQQPDNDREDR